MQYINAKNYKALVKEIKEYLKGGHIIMDKTQYGKDASSSQIDL